MRHQTILLCLLLPVIVACGGPEEVPAEDVPAIDNTAEVQAFYADNPDFFSFKTLADLPVDLTWEDGSHLPDIGSDKAVKGGTEYGRLSDFPRTLRTVGPDSNGSFRPFILDNVSLGLANRHPDEFEFHPALANSWAIDRDSKTIYVKLDPNATWSDGAAVTTDDFLFMFFFFRSSYIVAPWYNNWYGTQYTNITRYDDHTFSVSIPDAKPDMDARVLSLRPIPQHFFGELGDDYVDRYQWRFQPTTGAYIIKDEDIKKGRSIVLTRLDNWWARDKKFFKNRFNTDRIHLSVIRDTPKVFEAFKRGDIDQFGLNLSEYWYEKLPNDDSDVASGYIHKTVFYNQRPRPTYGLWMNSSRALLDDQNVRIGINHATNWQLVIDSYFRGDYSRMNTSSDGYADFTHPTLKSREFDIDKAQQHFASAGFNERGPDGILVNSEGQRLSFTVSTGYEVFKDVLTILKEEALKAGLEFRIEVLDGTAGWKKVQEKKHDIHLVAFAVSLEMYPRFWETYHSDNAYDKAYNDNGEINPERQLKTQTNNLESIAIPELDELINRYRASADRQEMIELAHRMTEIHHDYASFVPGFVQEFYRLGYWRWIQYPEGFNNKHSSGAGQLFVHWIAPGEKEATVENRSDNVTYPAQIKVFDQFSTVR
jgi:microcin C transport system substrate-binding protein